MKISVITVCFNSRQTIAQTLASVRAQTHTDVEHLIIDGGSTDGTHEVIAREGQHVARVLSEPDHGIYDAMNKGVRIATGDIVGFLNADDHYAFPGVLARVAQAMDARELDATLGDVGFFRTERPGDVVRRYRSGKFKPSLLGWGWMPAHPAAFFRRQLFAEIGGFKIDYRIAGDYEWIARAFSRRPLRYEHIPEILVLMQAGGVSNSGLRSTLRLNREVMRACRENGIPTNWLKLLSKYPAKFLEYFRP